MRLSNFSSTTDSARPDQGGLALPLADGIAQVSQHLSRLSPRAKILAVVTALPHANPRESQVLATSLIAELQGQPRRGASWYRPLLQRFFGLPEQDRLLRIAVISRWIFIEDESRRAVLDSGAAGWVDECREASESPDPWARRSSAQFLQHLPRQASTPLLLRLLHDPEPDIAAEAEATLFRGVLDRLKTGAPLDEHLAGVFDAATAFPDHRRKGVILGAIMMADRKAIRESETIAAWLDQATKVGGGATRAAMRGGSSWHFAQRAWEWIRMPEWTAACRVRLSAVKGVDEWNAVWSDWHLGLNPARRRALGELLCESDGCIPGAHAIHAISHDAAHGAIRMVAICAHDAKVREALSDAAGTHDSILVRRASVDAAPRSTVGRLAFDPDQRVARRAVLAESAVGEVLRPDCAVRTSAFELISRSQLLIRSSDPMIASWTAAEIRRHALQSRLSVLAQVAEDRAKAAQALAEIVITGSSIDATKAIVMARHAGIAGEISGEIVNRMIDGECDEKLLATCAGAFADAPKAIALPAIEHAARHSDPRVRANAVEAMASQAARSRASCDLKWFVELKSDNHHRVRANALRGWIRAGAGEDACGDLLALLTDVKPLPRLAGAWLLSRTMSDITDCADGDSWSQVRQRVRMLALEDEDQRVRARALALADSMSARETHLHREIET